MVIGGTLNSPTKKTFQLLSILKKCREKGKFGLAIKLISKYKIDKKKLEESYYD
jgi:hypothetical protein